MRFSPRFRSGYFSLELLLVIGIVSLIFAMTMPNVNRFFASTQHGLASWEAAQLCYFARMRAMAMDQDTTLALFSDRFCIVQDATFSQDPLTCITLPNFLQTDINGSGRVGFKPVGTTQYSGTLTLKKDSIIHYVTVQVGAGQINVR
jgi:Tfp pilus assembly protein FimT